jgi:hypothetical protein
VLVEDRRPVVLVVESNHLPAVVLQALGLVRVTLLTFRVVVRRTVHVDDGVGVLVHKIRSGLTGIDETLGGGQ